MPDKDVDPEGFALVERHMIHGPCGKNRPKSPCMNKGECTKAYPKPLSDHTHIDKSGFVRYRRRSNRKCLVLKGKTELGNQNVVPHNLSILKNIRLILMLNGAAEQKKKSKKRQWEGEKEKRPNVIKLPVHLPGQHRTVFDQSANLEEVIGREDIEKTMLTAWFVACETYEEARELTYIELPTRFVYHTSGKLWTPRKTGGAIGRVVYISPSASDVYFLRLLVNVVRGPRSFQELKTVGDVIFKKYREAFYARGLLDDDREWHDTIEEPSYWATGRQLRRLFVIILLFCQVINPLKLWNHTWKFLAEDILYMKRKEFRFPGLELTDEQLKQYTLIELELLLSENDQSLSDYPDIPLPDNSILTEISNTMLRQELSYDTQQETETHKELFATMNKDQRSVYDAVLESVDNQSGQLFFVYGAWGTGKTYLYRTIIANLRSSSRVVIPVASSGVAALLLPGGRTAHSQFKLPLTLREVSMCNIPRSSMLASLIAKSDLMIWDEAPMAHRQAFETLDRSLRDLLSPADPTADDRPFGGKTVLMGGDFRQILPVVPQGRREDTVLDSISKSYLWQNAKVYTLSINMRLKEEDMDFANWILKVGDGNSDTVSSHSIAYGEGEQIAVNKSFMIPATDKPHEALAAAAYPDFIHNYRNKKYLTERAVLTPTNNTVHDMNAYMLSQVPSEAREYLSCDSVELEATPEDDWTSRYTQEYLNSLEFSGLPNHRLCLKVGSPVMMLLTRVGDRIIEVEIMTGTKVGEQLLIPRIQLSPLDTQHPFTFCRRKYPLRLCYAMTINKMFTHGQLYVALSRVTSPEGFKILEDSADSSGDTGVTNIVYKEIFKGLSDTQKWYRIRCL
ncbi:hypothetical protein N665_0339s0078 [Sinapis alba]|nr:hypothetical protein N665_0339s0078 [Sinapis alba]